jgi:hypothetical protein
MEARHTVAVISLGHHSSHILIGMGAAARQNMQVDLCLLSPGCGVRRRVLMARPRPPLASSFSKRCEKQPRPRRRPRAVAAPVEV